MRVYDVKMTCARGRRRVRGTVDPDLEPRHDADVPRVVCTHGTVISNR